MARSHGTLMVNFFKTHRMKIIILIIALTFVSCQRNCGPEKPRTPWQSRNLKVMNRAFHPQQIETHIRNDSGFKVFEFGTGEGRVLIELQKRFPKTTFVGLNKEPWFHACSDKSYLQTGEFYGILSKDEKIERIPSLIFHDADNGDIPELKPSSFDLIFSQYSIRYVLHKQKLLASMWEALKPGGVLLITMKEMFAQQGGRNLSLEEYFRISLGASADLRTGRNVFKEGQYESVIDYVFAYKKPETKAPFPCQYSKDQSGKKKETGGVETHYVCPE